MRRSDAACIFKKAIPTQVLRSLMVIQSESQSITGHTRSSGPVIGLGVVEARSSLNAVLEKLDKDPREVRTA